MNLAGNTETVFVVRIYSVDAPADGRTARKHGVHTVTKVMQIPTVVGHRPVRRDAIHRRAAAAYVRCHCQLRHIITRTSLANCCTISARRDVCNAVRRRRPYNVGIVEFLNYAIMRAHNFAHNW